MLGIDPHAHCELRDLNIAATPANFTARRLSLHCAFRSLTEIATVLNLYYVIARVGDRFLDLVV